MWKNLGSAHHRHAQFQTNKQLVYEAGPAKLALRAQHQLSFFSFFPVTLMHAACSQCSDCCTAQHGCMAVVLDARSAAWYNVACLRDAPAEF
jgi:hypothetical protein